MSRVYEHRPLGAHSHASLPHSSSSAVQSSSQHQQPQQQQAPPPGSSHSLLPHSSNGMHPVTVGGAGGANNSVHASHARLNDLLEFVKAEFDQVSGETGILRAQREEYEALINNHANELHAMRAMSYDLERKHHDDKRALQEENIRLQDENVRLRQQMDSRASNSTPVPNLLGAGQGRPTLPPLMASAQAAAGSVRPGSSGAADHPNKRLRTDEEDSRFNSPSNSQNKPKNSNSARLPALSGYSGPNSRPNSTGPAPGSHAATAQNNGLAPIVPGGREGATTPNGSASSHKEEIGETRVSENFDPETVSKDLKKEGSDWMTMFNPNVKRVLDVGLVHTLVHDSVVCCVRFSPDGKILATGCNRNTTLYDTKTGAKIGVLNDEPPGPRTDNYIRSASFSPDGKYLATGAEDRMIRIWSLQTQRIWKILTGHKSEIYSLAFSPDGKKLVSGSGDKTARIWELSSGKSLFTLTIDDVTIAENGPIDAGVTSVVLSPDGKFLAAGSLDTVVRIWDALTGNLLDKLKGHKDSVYSVAFSPDGNYLVSGSLDKTLKMWDMAGLRAVIAANGAAPGTAATSTTGSTKEVSSSAAAAEPAGKTSCLTTLQGHKDYVLSVDISPDGAWIVSGSKDRGVQFWSPTSAKAQLMLQGHKNSVISVSVSPQGGMIATGSGDWSARIWTYSTL